jgi:hypothetical protein
MAKDDLDSIFSLMVRSQDDLYELKLSTNVIQNLKKPRQEY